MPRKIISPAALGVAVIVGAIGMNDGRAEHGPGVRVRDYAPRGRDEAAIIRLIRTVTEGWERRDAKKILSAYAPDAVQRAWNEPARMIDVAGIRAEALGAFADPRLGRVEFDDRIHRIYVVNNSAVVEINQRFHGWGRDHYYRDFWMFARRDGRWWLVRYDYEPQPPFDPRR
jgi:Putative lumazine-binding